MATARILVSAMAILLLLVGASPHPAEAADTQAARALVQNAVDDGLASFMGKAHALPDRARLLDQLLRRYTDPTMLSASILGRYWDRISPAEQAVFTDTFMRYLVSSYVSLLKAVNPDIKITVGGAVDLGPRVRVSCLAILPSDPGGPIPVEWDVVTAADGRPVLIDVTADGISIIRAMRDDFASVLRSSGGKIAPLLEALQRKIDAADRYNAAAQ